MIIAKDHGSLARRLATGIRVVVCLALASCSPGALNAGDDTQRGALPVDARNPIIICNDGGHDNWQGEYAVLLANSAAISLAGIIISTGGVWKNLNDNVAEWKQMLDAATRSGLENIPSVTASDAAPLARPSDNSIDSTKPNRSAGAALINNLSRQLALPYRPLVVVTGGKLTDVADAYLTDRTVAQRIVVVSSLGSGTKDGGLMGVPNGEMDPWADVIVAQRLRYIQVSVLYDQTSDITPTLLAALPANDFTKWIQGKQPGILTDTKAADQVALAAVAIRDFVPGDSQLQRLSQRGVDANGLPILVNDASGPVQLVTQVNAALAAVQLGWMLTHLTER